MGDPQAGVMSSIPKLLMLAIPAIVLLAAAIALIAVLLSRKPRDEQAESGGSSGTLWITLAVIGIVVVLGCAGAFVFFMQLEAQPAPPAQVQLVPPQPSGGQPVQKQPDAEEL